MTDLEAIREEHRRRAEERAMLKAMAEAPKAKPKLPSAVARVNQLAESIKGTGYQEPPAKPEPQIIWPEGVKVTKCPPAKGQFDEFRKEAA